MSGVTHRPPFTETQTVGSLPHAVCAVDPRHQFKAVNIDETEIGDLQMRDDR